MKNTIKIACLVLAIVLSFSTATCSSNSDGKIVNSVEELKAYLDKQSSNSPDKPIKVVMNSNDLVFWRITEVIISSGKYVSLDLSGCLIKTIPNNAFFDDDTRKSCSGLTGIILPESITYIGELSFAFCTNLKSVIIPNNVTRIESGAFGGCTSLASVTIPNSVTRIGSDAFAKCTSLTSVIIPKSVREIYDYAFYECTSLTSVKFECTISSDNFNSTDPFPGDLHAKYLAGGIGTYTRPSGSDTWTKQ